MALPPIVQSVEGGGLSGNGQLFNWIPPSAGNVIVVASAFSVGNRNLSIPPGYTSVGSNTGGNPNRPTVAVFGKIADGTETDVLVEWSNGAGQWVAQIQEFDALDISVDPAKSGSGGSVNNAASMDSGVTGSVEGFAYALFASESRNGETPSGSDGFIFSNALLAGGEGDLVLDVFASETNKDSAGTYGMTATWISSAARASLCVAADVARTVDGEALKDYQRASLYRITNEQGFLVYIHNPDEDIPLSGLNRGQARKHIASMTGQFNIQVEP